MPVLCSQESLLRIPPPEQVNPLGIRVKRCWKRARAIIGHAGRMHEQGINLSINQSAAPAQAFQRYNPASNHLH